MRAKTVLVVALMLVVVPGGSTVTSADAGSPALGQDVGAGSPQQTPASSCEFPLTLTDATGTDVTLDREPRRVVTLNPSAAQTMWEIGAREKVVGLTEYAAYLEGADSRANVSGASAIVVAERVVELSPDLVLAPNATPDATVEQLREAGLTVYRFPRAETIDGVYGKTLTIGRLVGECDGAAETIARMRDRIETARRAAEEERRPDVLYAFFGYTAGEGTFINEVIEAAGGNNVAADYGVVGYRQLSPEVVVEADPDWIVRNTNDPVLPPGAPFNSTTAVREGQVVVVPIEHLNQPAPRILRGITALAKHFHPDAYAAANASVTSTDTGSVNRATPSSTTSTPGTATKSGATETPGQAGFGTLSVLVAVLVAFGWVRARG